MIIQRQVVGSMVYLGRGFVPEPFCWCWGQLIQYNNEFLLGQGEIIHLMRGNGSGQHLTRNSVAAQMLGDWVLMLDSDHTFDPDLVHRMLRLFQRDNLDVLSALYQYKDYPYEFATYIYSGGYKHLTGFDFKQPGQTVRVDCVGAGTLLVRRRVFERIAAELRQRPFDLIGEYGEDFSFFERCRMLGIKAYVAPGIQTYHLRTEETVVEDYDPSGMTKFKEVTLPV